MSEEKGVIRAPVGTDLPATGTNETNQYKARLTITGAISYQSAGGEAIQYPLNEGVNLQTVEDPYDRHQRFGEDWQPIEVGWIEGASIVYLFNTEGGGFQRIPTEEEKAAVTARIIEVAVGNDPYPTPFLLLPPGRRQSFLPADIKRLVARCQKGIAKCRIVILPN